MKARLYPDYQRDYTNIVMGQTMFRDLVEKQKIYLYQKFTFTNGRLKNYIEKNSIFITETGCQIWLGGLTHGYGCLQINGKAQLMHRVNFQLHYQRKIKKDKMLLHSCDIPCCINPYHLREGTAAENRNDAFQRKRLTQSQLNHYKYKGNGKKNEH